MIRAKNDSRTRVWNQNFLCYAIGMVELMLIREQFVKAQTVAKEELVLGLLELGLKQAEIGVLIGVGTERVRQIKAKALVRRKLNSEKK